MRFFFYGTLLDRHGNPIAAALHQRLEPGVAAALPGQLHAIPDPGGWYPALIPGGPGLVLGQLHAAGARFSAQDLALMDGYEDYRPHDPAGSDYVRRCLPVWPVAPNGTTHGTTGESGESARSAIEAFVYCYNRPLPADARAIPDGDFAAWLSATGACAYGSAA